MLFTKPIPFLEAIASRKAKRILPTTAGSKELAELAPEIRERAMFSARVMDARFLSNADKLINGIVSPTSSPGARPGRKSPLSPIEARAKLQNYLESIGYSPEKGKEGGLQDLSSNRRIDLIIDTNTKMAHGYGQFAVANDPDVLDDIPCQELYRLEGRKVPREWKTRWVNAGGKLYDGRMIARKDSPIWKSISRFGNPYPPFDYNSGMWTREIFRREAEELGVIKASDVVLPQDRNLNDGVEASMPKGISSGLANVLKQVFTVIGEKIVLEGLA